MLYRGEPECTVALKNGHSRADLVRGSPTSFRVCDVSGVNARRAVAAIKKVLRRRNIAQQN